MSDDVPNIVSGTVTNHRADGRNSRQRTPNWLRAFYATLATLVVLTAIGMLPQLIGC